MDISVVVPARNRAAVLGRALQSVIAQTYRPIEIIVVDDGSDDDGATVKTAKAFADYGIPLHVIELPARRGAPNARNLGIQQAKGNWIALLDSDDAWAPDKLAAQIAVIEPGVVAVFTDTRFENPNGKLVTKFAGKPVALSDLIYENCLGGCSAALVERAAFDAIGGFEVDLPSCQDWDLWLKLYDKGAIKVVDRPLTLYFFDGGERISRNTNGILRGHEHIYARILQRKEVVDAESLRRFQDFHLAQTKVYFAGTRQGVLKPALRNVIAPHPRVTRKSALHLLISGIFGPA